MQAERLNILIQNQRLLNEETVMELKLLTEKYPWFQLGWMLYLKNLKQIDSPEYQTILKKVAVRVPNRKLLYNYLNSDSQNHSEKNEFENSLHVFDETENETENGEGNSLINKFLLKKPGAIRRISDDEDSKGIENRVAIIEKSVTENDELITDTLASIYLQQKNYEKALTAYKKLSLKYPEKSIYFATQIEEIEKLKNTNL
jgi:tetratricopeptide (TPR) repeat protein